MRNTREHCFNFAALMHGNSLFEMLVVSVGNGRPADRGLLADAFRHAGVSPKAVTREDVLRLMPVIQSRLGAVNGEAVVEARVRGLRTYLDRYETLLAS